MSITEKTLLLDLAKNYFDSSTRGRNYRDVEIDESYELYMSEVFKQNKKLKSSKFVRNVVVIGAGASYASYNHLLLASKSSEKIKSILGHRVYESKSFLTNLLRFKTIREKTHKTLNVNLLDDIINHYNYHIKKYEEELRHTKILHPEDEELDFESTLSLLSEFYTLREIRAKIQGLYGKKYFPSLTYEVIAHLFKHRFVDAIINFNFDELLDQSIREELGGTEYREILSDGHCGDFSELIIDGRLKLPVYIKPHGTASHKSTLRFTKTDYLGIPRDIENLITDLLSGKVGSEHELEGHGIERLNLILLGFNLKSVEFNNLLKEVNNERKGSLDIHMYFYDINDIAEQNFRNQFGVPTKVLGVRTLKLPRHIDCTTIGKGNSNLEGKLSRLWVGVSEQFENRYKPRDISRNRIICDLFKEARTKDLEWEIDNLEESEKKKRIIEIMKFQLAKAQSRLYQEEEDTNMQLKMAIIELESAIELLERRRNLWVYAFLRVCVELIISIFLYKGRINLSQLINGRVGIYYHVYYEYFTDWKKRERNRVDKIPISIYQILNQLGMTRFDHFDREVFILKEVTENDNPEEYKISFDQIFQSLSNNKIGVLLTQQATNFEEDIAPTYQKLVKRVQELVGIRSELEEIYAMSTYDVRPKFSQHWYHLFDHHHKDKVLHTRLAWKMCFQNLITKRDWSHVFLASERGRTVQHNKAALTAANKSFTIILCENTYDYNPKKLGGKGELKFIAHWELNHHISIFLKKISYKTYIRLSDLSFDLTIKLMKDFTDQLTEIGFKLVDDNFQPTNINNAIYVELGYFIPREAIYFKIDPQINEANPILVTSQFSTESYREKGLMNEPEGEIEEDRIWDSDLVYLTKKFYQYYVKSSPELGGKSGLERKEYHGDHKFFEWLGGIFPE